MGGDIMAPRHRRVLTPTRWAFLHNNSELNQRPIRQSVLAGWIQQEIVVFGLFPLYRPQANYQLIGTSLRFQLPKIAKK